MIISQEIQVRWADLDQNRHLRHSVYYDYAAMVRFQFLSDHGLTTHKLEELNIGPILFREEAVFRREIRMEDKLVIETGVLKARKDYSRWTIHHRIIKNDDVLAAIITVDGAWLDTEKRKLVIPNDSVQSVFSTLPKAEEFEWLEPKG